MPGSPTKLRFILHDGPFLVRVLDALERSQDAGANRDEESCAQGAEGADEGRHGNRPARAPLLHAEDHVREDDVDDDQGENPKRQAIDRQRILGAQAVHVELKVEKLHGRQNRPNRFWPGHGQHVHHGERLQDPQNLCRGEHQKQGSARWPDLLKKVTPHVNQAQDQACNHYKDDRQTLLGSITWNADATLTWSQATHASSTCDALPSLRTSTLAATRALLWVREATEQKNTCLGNRLELIALLRTWFRPEAFANRSLGAIQTLLRAGWPKGTLTTLAI
mmetsp:Transcript_91376/g.293472  ORF Transcript_91376/g.293472 Transcript_91376/m.293472 type:complete len:279 (+) Transcript_91376:1933-2769(+)